MATLVEAAWDQVKGEVPAWREKVGDAPALIGALGKKYAELKRVRRGGEVPEALHGALPRPLGLPVAGGLLPGPRRSRTLEGDARRLPDQHRTRRAGARQGPGGDRQLPDEAGALGRREEIRRAGGGDLGRLGDDLRLASATRGSRIGNRPSSGSGGPPSAIPTATWPNWYLFCKRTGHGDVEAARAFAEEYVAAVADRPDLARAGRGRVLLLVDRIEPKKALGVLREGERDGCRTQPPPQPDPAGRRAGRQGPSATGCSRSSAPGSRSRCPGSSRSAG